MVELVKTHGPIVYAIILFGLSCVVAGVLSIALSKDKLGVYAGFAALGLVVATSSISVIAVMGARIAGQRAADAVDPSLREPLLQEAHLQSVGMAKLGVAFGVIGLVLGAVGLARSLQSQEKRSSRPSPEEVNVAAVRPFGSRAGLAGLVLSGIAFFSVVSAAMPFLVKPPTGAAARGDPESRLVAASGLLEEGHFDEGCTALEQAFRDGADPKKAGVRHIDGLVSECFEQRLGKALSGIPPSDRTRILTALSESKLPLQQGQQERLRRALDAK